MPPAERLTSLDALRGFDMMWIVGADTLGHALAQMDGGPFVRTLATQLDHVAWEGFRFYDLIFPLFVFLIGVAIPFSLGRLRQREGRAAAVWRVTRRAILLYLLGLFYYGGLATPIEGIRWVGVLQRLALCYFFAGLMYLYFSRRGLVIACAVLLAGYWALLSFVPVRDINVQKEAMQALLARTGAPDAMTAFRGTTNRVSGSFQEGVNLANHVDFQYLPGRRWDGNYDPEGLLSTLPAMGSCLLGVLAGLLLSDTRRSQLQKAALLAAAGIAGLVLGHLWSFQFPVIKQLWTSSYVLVAGGWSALLLALFYLVIDVWRVRGWAWPFVWIGANALTIYLLSNIVDFDALSRRFAGGDVARWLDAMVAPHFSEVVLALVGISLCFLICRFLYRRQIFLRL